MSYLQDRNKEFKNKKLIISFVFSLFLILISYFGFWNYLGNLMHSIGGVFWKNENKVSDVFFDSSYLTKTKKSIFNENTLLTERNKELSLSMVDYNILKKENDSLKELLNRKPSDEKLTLTNILVKPNRSPYDTIVIDIGKNFNLEKGQIVFANINIPIGEIAEVYDDSSLVKMYSSPDEHTLAQIDVLNTNVDLIGRGGGNFEMLIPKELEVTEGLAVILPHLNSRVVATVVKTISSPKDPTNKILLKSPVNVQELKWVFVLIK